MKRVKVFISVVVALALVAFFCAPMVQAQVLEDTVHQVKISASAVVLEPGFVLSNTGGKVAGPVILKNPQANDDTLGFDYQIWLLDDTGVVNPTDPCNEFLIGTLTTYTAAENVALGELSIIGRDIPEPGLNLFARFFAKVKTTQNKRGFKSVAGWAEVEVDGAGPPDPDGMSKKFNAQAKEKTLQKLGLQCTP